MAGCGCEISAWKAAAGLSWAGWGGETVVYCDASGDTLLLNPLAAALLRRLALTATPSAALTGLLATELGRAEDGELAAEIGDIITSLGELGIIEPLCL